MEGSSDGLGAGFVEYGGDLVGGEFVEMGQADQGGLVGGELVQGLADHTAAFVGFEAGRAGVGVGGLVRAYGAAAAAVLDEAPIRETRVTRPVVITHGYEQSGAVQAALAAFDLEPTSAEYGERVRLVCRVPVSRVDAFLSTVRDRTAGRAEAEVAPRSA